MRIPLPHSIGRFYELATRLLGFNPKKHAGKITGLAANGNPERLYSVVSDLLTINNLTVRVSSQVFVLQDLYMQGGGVIPKPFIGHLKEDIAASFQKRLEDVVTELITNLLKHFPAETLVLSGGVMANVKLNQEILHRTGARLVIAHPAMSDVGQPLGAAMAAYASLNPGFKPFRLEHVYLGPSFSAQEVRAALEESKISYQEPLEYASAVGKLLADKKTVALFQGRMEYGPRALGNRSILYSAADRSVNDWLNKKLKRTEFMPFAPVTLNTHVYDCYDRIDIDGAGDSVKFMTMAVKVTQFMKEEMPAAVHVDGTARPQVIDRATNPLYFDCVEAYAQLTGLPSVVNTSFNMHEEPIICTPKEAIIAYEQSQLDVLAMPPYLVVRKRAKNAE